MNRLLAVGLTVALACSANAGGNPNVRVYIDFDPPNYVHETTPEPYATVEAYVCMDHLDSGMTTISFRVTDFVAEFPGVFPRLPVADCRPIECHDRYDILGCTGDKQFICRCRFSCRDHLLDRPEPGALRNPQHHSPRNRRQNIGP